GPPTLGQRPPSMTNTAACMRTSLDACQITCFKPCASGRISAGDSSCKIDQYARNSYGRRTFSLQRCRCRCPSHLQNGSVVGLPINTVQIPQEDPWPPQQAAAGSQTTTT